MTFTYDNPNNSDLEAVRFRLQDIDKDRPLLADEEIEYELAEADNNILQAALSCAEALVARGSHQVTKKISGEMTLNYSDLTCQYERLVESLRAKIQRGNYVFTAPKIAKVADTEHYPAEFEPTDVARPGWED